MTTPFLLSLLLSSCYARDVAFTKQVNPEVLQAELKAAGFAVKSIHRIGSRQWIVLDGAGDPGAVIAAHVYVAPDAQVTAKREQAKALALKWRARTITAEEKDELLALLAPGLLGVAP